MTALTEEDIEVLEGHQTRLRSYANVLFYGETGARLEIDPLKRAKLMLGFYVSSQALPPKERVIKPFPDHDHEIRMQYLLMVDAKPLPIQPSPSGEPDEYVIGEWQRSGQSLPTPLLHWSTLADFSEDDEAELLRCGVPKSFAKAFGGMSRDARHVYKQALGTIRDKPPELDKVKAQTFLRTLAGLGTYSPKSGAYFEKWQPDDGTGRARTWPGSLSTDFIKRASSEVLLGVGRDYVLVTSELSFELYEIHKEDDGELKLTSQLGGYETKHGMLDWSRPRTVVLFHALAGEKQTKKRTPQQFRVLKATPQRLLLDPRGMVESINGGEAGGKLLDLNDSFDWFVEMCIAYFPNMFYPIDFDRHGKNFERSDAFKMLKSEMDKIVRWLIEGNDRDVVAEKLDEIRRAEIESWLKQDGVIVFPQTAKFGDHVRLVGAENHWIYMRDLRTGAVFAEHMEDFIASYRVGVIATDVYESTRGVIPLVGLMFAAAGIGFGAAVAATALGGTLVRKVITDFTTKELTSMAIKRAARYMAPAIVAFTGRLVATLFVYHDPTNVTAKRWRAFAEGFFQGYVTNTLYDQFYKKLILGTLTKGPKEYRAYVMIKRVYAAIDKARVIINKLEEELDEESVKNGLVKFETAATHLLQGVALLFPAVHYAEHHDVCELAETVASGHDGATEVEAPDEDLYQFESSVQIAKIASDLRPYVQDVKKLLDTSAPLTIAIGAAVFKRDIAIGVRELAKASGKGVAWAWDKRPDKMKGFEQRAATQLKNPTIWKILAGVALASGVIHEVVTGGKGVKAVKDGAVATVDGLAKAFEMLEPLFEELVTSWPGSTEDRARTHGELVGGMLGAIAFNKFLFGTSAEKKAAKTKKFGDAHLGQKWIKLNESPILGSSMKRNLKVGIIGPILAAIFRRYISLFRHLKTHGWPNAPERTEEMIGTLLSEAENDELEQEGLKHLSLFKTEEESTSFSLSELVKVLFRLRTMVRNDLRSYLASRTHERNVEITKILPEEFDALINAAKTWGMPDLAAQYAPQLFAVMASHLYVALSELGQAFEALFEPFTKGGKGWFVLLKELGLDIGDADAALKELNAAKQDALRSFKDG